MIASTVMQLTQNGIDQLSKIEPYGYPYLQISGINPNILADQIIKTNPIVTFEDTGEIYRYHPNKGVYVQDGEVFIEKEIQKHLGVNTKNKHISETIGAIKRKTYSTRASFTSSPILLVVKNGLLDIYTGVLYPYDSTHFSISTLPVKYDPDAECPNFIKFLTEVVDYEGYVTLKEFIGYCLMKKYTYHKALMLYGKGRNGKSTFLKVIEQLFGEDNISHVALHDLSERFASSDLYGKMVNICDDLSSKDLQNTGNFKTLTSGGSLRAEKKFKPSFTFNNTAKLIFATNSFPRTSDNTLAFFSRWLIVTFSRIFEYGKNADPDLIERLTTDDELSGILNWALDGLYQLRKNGYFIYDKTPNEIKRMWHSLNFGINGFLNNNTVKKTNGMVPKKKLHKEYKKYCQVNHLPVMSYSQFCKELYRRKYISKTRSTANASRVQCFKGIELR